MKKFIIIFAVISFLSCGETKTNNKTDDDSAVNDASNDEMIDDTADQNDEIADETIDEATDDTTDEITDGTNDDDSTNPMDFDVRKPIERTVSCDGEELTQLDKDWVCTFNYDGKSGFVYIQSNMTSCEVIMSANPIFTTVGSWISFNGKVSEITGANYDWGGNHHNDFLEFTYSGEYFKLYHSSFGYGWRSCQNMDCMQVGNPVTEDGCTKERTLPSVCQEVQADGTIGDFTDSFAPCEGDPNYEG
ncbi:MAG TPA: hypothetical protein PKG52_02830 [bacterium]|nr:hypothetical protein [bacterium]HPS28748.1 hypothetical protein [bacterium]